MAKFLQDTVEEIAVSATTKKSQEKLKEFADFVQRVSSCRISLAFFRLQVSKDNRYETSTLSKAYHILTLHQQKAMCTFTILREKGL